MANTAGLDRGFRPLGDAHPPEKRIAHALEQIALNLSALDHNVQLLAVLQKEDSLPILREIASALRR